jgi:hypothetical protein
LTQARRRARSRRLSLSREGSSCSSISAEYPQLSDSALSSRSGKHDHHVCDAITTYRYTNYRAGSPIVFFPTMAIPTRLEVKQLKSMPKRCTTSKSDLTPLIIFHWGPDCGLIRYPGVLLLSSASLRATITCPLANGSSVKSLPMSRKRSRGSGSIL